MDTKTDIVNEETVEEKEVKKKPGKVGAVFFGLLVIFIYLIIMSVAQLFVLVPILTRTINEAAGDMAKYSELYVKNLAENGTQVTVSTCIGTLIAAVVMVIWYFFGVYRKSVKNGTYESVLPKLKNIKSIAFLVCGAITAYSLAILVNDLVGIMMPVVSGVFNEAMNTIIGGVEILGLLVSWVLAPIGEEVCLRGIIGNRMKKSYGLIGWMILSGILFGVYHMNPIQGLYAIPIGIFLGFVSYKYKSVIPCIIAHAINNLIAGFSSALGFQTLYVPIIMIVVFGTLMIVIGKKIDFFKENQFT